MNAFSKAAALCILVGVVLLLGPVFGFSTLSADRGVAVNVAADQGDGFLGIVDRTNEENVKVRSNTAGEPIRLLDNGIGIDSPSEQIDVSLVEFDGQADNGLTVSVESDNGEYPIIVECDGSNKAKGLMTFDITVAGEASVKTTYTTTADVDVNCGNRGGGPNLHVESVEPVDGGFVEFALTNTGDTIHVGAVSIDHANSNEITETVTMRSNSDETTVSPNSRWITDDTQVDIRGSRVQVADSATIEINKFDTGMAGESFDMTFYDTRGGSNERAETVRVEIPCDAAGNHGCSGTDNDVVLSDNEQSNGKINTDGDILLGDGSQVNDGLDAGGNVITGDGSSVSGDFWADGEILIGNTATVYNGLSAGSTVTIGDEATISGDLSAGGDVTVGTETTVNDNIDADGDVVLEDNSTVHGNIDTTGTVFVGCDVTTNGNIDAQDIVDQC